MTIKFDVTEHFRELVNNAFEFTTVAVEKIDKSPKFALIDLYTALELFLKARLLREHWSLVVQEPKFAKVASFVSGDFVSAGFDEICSRLQHIAQAPIPKAALTNFDGLRKSRNKIVHFVDPALAKEKESTAKAYSELWGSWRHLVRLLDEDWKDHFHEYGGHLTELTVRLEKHAGLLASAYEEVKAIIAQRSQQGKYPPIECPHCKYEAAFVREEQRWGEECLCMVCKSVTTLTTQTDAPINCPHCQFEFQFVKRISSTDGLLQRSTVACPQCAHSFSLPELVDLCSKKYGGGDAWCDEKGPHIAECHKCRADPPSVFYMDRFWTCVNCFERGFQAMHCDCGKFATDGAETMKYLGCFECQEGLAAEIAFQYGPASES